MTEEEILQTLEEITKQQEKTLDAIDKIAESDMRACNAALETIRLKEMEILIEIHKLANS